MFWENAVEYLRNGACQSLQTCTIVFSTPEYLLVGISGALGMKESHFVSKMYFEKNAVGYVRNGESRASNLCHCVQHPWKLIGRDYMSSRHERKPLCQQKCVLRKCCGVCQKWWMLELSKLCHCVQHPCKVSSGDFGALGTKESHFVSRNVFWENAVVYVRNSAC